MEHVMKLERVYCCAMMCLTMLVSTVLEETHMLRHLYSSLTRQERKQWVLDYLNLHKRRMVNGAFEYVFLVGARNVCFKSWITILGLPMSSFYKIRNLVERGVIVIDHMAGRTGMLATKTYSAMVWLSSFANTYGDRLPDTSKIQLPMCATRLSVYEQMKDDHGEENTISYAHFLKIWKKNFYYIMIPRVSRFSKCDTCILIKQKLESTTDKSAREELKQRRHAHLIKQSEQRRKYYKHRSKAKNNPHKYLSIIIDGMDQNKTCLPHMVSESKFINQMWKLKVHLTGVVVHGVATHGFSDYNQVKHDSNLTITVLMKILLLMPKLPGTLYLQMDNCGRENKNSFSRKLHHSNANALTQLMDIWSGIQSPGLFGYKLEETYDFVSWMSPYLNGIEGHSKPHAYKICRNEIGEVVLLWKAWPTDAGWNYCAGSGGIGILTENPKGLPTNAETNKITTDRLKANLSKNERIFKKDELSWWSNFFDEIEEGDAEKEKIH
ncbi:uncharacterized protein LOC123565917 [Mercenaria mercenaria]|uniref:uncharacterized protein LOC123565917 n=1 Tax=Mercenaria mercenaria TaxID=6596 RepID=UPI00234E671E|nr:uncharacterized protein LOC123565917 [Mercenaria mercenaria]